MKVEKRTITYADGSADIRVSFYILRTAHYWDAKMTNQCQNCNFLVVAVKRLNLVIKAKVFRKISVVQVMDKVTRTLKSH